MYIYIYISKTHTFMHEVLFIFINNAFLSPFLDDNNIVFDKGVNDSKL